MEKRNLVSTISNQTNENQSVGNFSGFREVVENLRMERIATVIFLVIFVTGVCGNALIVYVFAKNRLFRTITNIFLLNLAIVDLVYLVLCCPFSTMKLFLGYWPFGNILCKLLRYIMIVCLAVNVMTLVAIGVDRLLVVVFPLFSKPYRKKKYAYICVIGLWVISFIIFTPFLNITKEIRVGRPYCIEQLDEHSRFVYAILMFVVFYAIPQIFLGTCYTIISLKLWNSKYSSEMNQVAIVTLKIKGKIVKLTFAIILAFAVCWLPMHIGALLNAKSGGSEFNYYLQLFAPCFAYTTVSLNPIIYCFMSKSLRKSLKAAIHCDDHTIKQRKAKPLLLQMQM